MLSKVNRPQMEHKRILSRLDSMISMTAEEVAKAPDEERVAFHHCKYEVQVWLSFWDLEALKAARLRLTPP
jgi:peroxiredoxin family protein